MKTQIENWLKSITDEGNLPENVQAIYIGLFDGKNGHYMIHFLGSAEFDPDDDDWACESEGDYFPKNRYLDSEVSMESDWFVFQNDIVQIIQELKSNPTLILSQTENIAVGFDSGELNYID